MSPADNKWTQGPWAVHPFRAAIIAVVPADQLERPIGGAEDEATDLVVYAQEICGLHWPDRHRSEEEVYANAKLMAASPALYEALELATQIIADMFRLGIAYTPVADEAVAYPAYYIAEGVMPKLSAALSLALGKQS